MNKFVKLVLCIMVLSILLAAPQSVSAKTKQGINIKTTFSKAMGEEMSRQKYDKDQNGYLSKKEIRKIQYIGYTNTDGKINLQGISKLKYIKTLDLEAKYLTNLKEIKKLGRLKKLKLKADKIEKKVY